MMIRKLKYNLANPSFTFKSRLNSKQDEERKCKLTDVEAECRNTRRELR